MPTTDQLQAELSFLRNKFMQFMPNPRLRFEVHLTEHCNLNCVGCFHFSPIADKSYLEYDSFYSDFKRISELSRGEERSGEGVEVITLCGGEPLLHPEIIRIIATARDLFPKTRLIVLTNGTKLLSMSSGFFDTCNRCNIEICASKYPNINWYKIEKHLQNFGLKLDFHCFQDGNRVTLGHHRLDIYGNQDIKSNWYRCHRGNICITLKNGRLYTCIMPAHIEHFNKYFNKQLEVTAHDYIDIYKSNNINEILNFLSMPIPFCRYCDLEHYNDGVPFGESKRDISEWT
jgi:hypothetical protein